MPKKIKKIYPLHRPHQRGFESEDDGSPEPKRPVSIIFQ